ncbi:hypothetical protein [Oceaniglobus roseus]|uniref:hypothetical protein n=1 Tax=Oceaniglobus roseus TaxID=1737570 RepID=UPI000C7F6A2D|nr:hypothetical protein [Kandeliimicrobium roseum]
MLFTLRLAFSLLRSALVACSIVLAGWLTAVPPTPAERQALDLPLGRVDAEGRRALANLRLARAALDIAPGLAVGLITRQGHGEASSAEVEAALRAIARGQPDDTPPEATEPPRRAGGAKFVKAPKRG